MAEVSNVVELQGKAGSVVVFNATKGGWFSSAQRLFTGQPFTHTAVFTYPVCNQTSYMGADMVVSIQPWGNAVNNPTMDYIVYTPVGFTEEQIQVALAQTYIKFAANEYGFAQVLWFVYRGLMWSVFKKDVRKQHNFFPNGVICSELGWWYFYFLGEFQPKIRDFINQWRPDTFHSGDTAYVLHSLKEFFMVDTMRWHGDALNIKFTPQGVK